MATPEKRAEAVRPKAEIPYGPRLAMIASASLIAESATFPIDFAKTRMQLAIGRVGFFDVLASAVRHEGLGAVYAALPSAVMRHWVYTSIRITLYEDLRNRAAGGPGRPTTAATKAAVSLTAGGVSQFIASPADRIKVVVIKEGGQRSVVEAARGIYGTQGISGFYQGVAPNVFRACTVNLAELLTYDTTKRLVLQHSGMEEGLATHGMSAFVSGFTTAAFSTPADVIKSRVMGGESRSVLALSREIMMHEGIGAFWKGFLPNWARIGPWQMSFWMMYEQVRSFYGYEGL